MDTKVSDYFHGDIGVVAAQEFVELLGGVQIPYVSQMVGGSSPLVHPAKLGHPIFKKAPFRGAFL